MRFMDRVDDGDIAGVLPYAHYKKRDDGFMDQGG
jgi:hypothetical protein